MIALSQWASPGEGRSVDQAGPDHNGRQIRTTHGNA
jgi:hypothetical protein